MGQLHWQKLFAQELYAQLHLAVQTCRLRPAPQLFNYVGVVHTQWTAVFSTQQSFAAVFIEFSRRKKGAARIMENCVASGARITTWPRILPHRLCAPTGAGKPRNSLAEQLLSHAPSPSTLWLLDCESRFHFT